MSSLFISASYAENEAAPEQMNPEKLRAAIEQYSTDITVNNNVISFRYQNVTLYCIWDANADRMRIITPIANLSDLEPELIVLALKANYHTVLDARYAIGDDILYSVFIHPLSPITTAELESAIRQVATAALTFGSSFTSGELVFPGNSAEPAGKKKVRTL